MKKVVVCCTKIPRHSSNCCLEAPGSEHHEEFQRAFAPGEPGWENDLV